MNFQRSPLDFRYMQNKSTEIYKIEKRKSILQKNEIPVNIYQKNNLNNIFQIKLSSQKNETSLLKINHINTKHLNSSITNNIKSVRTIKSLSPSKFSNKKTLEKHFLKKYKENPIFAKQPDFKNLLSKTMIKSFTRAKMVDWIISVIHFYSKRSNDFTIYRAIMIMDLFIKNFKDKILQDSDLHLIGIAVIYIASKYEDIYHIPLNEVFNDIGFKKFSIEQILEKESEILCSLSFNISYPSFSDYIDYYLIQYAYEFNAEFYNKISYFSHYILKMILLEVNFYSFDINICGLCAIIFVLRNFDIDSEPDSSVISSSFMGNQNKKFSCEKKILEKIYRNNHHISPKTIEICCKNILLLYENYQKRYQGLNSILNYYKKYEIKKIEKIFYFN
jgi:hypothetical protein